MRIMSAQSSRIPSLAANSIQIMKMSEALANLGHHVTLITKRSNDNLPSMKDSYAYYGVKSNFDFFKFYSLPGKIGLVLYPFTIAMAAYLLRTDVIYTRCLKIAFIAAYMGHKVIFERHDPLDYLSGTERWMLNKLIQHKNLKSLVLTTRALADALRKEYNISDEMIIVASNGSDPITEIKETSPFVRKPGRPVVGHIGHLYKGRGTDLIIALARALPAIDFHIIGGTPKDIEFWKMQANDVSNLYFHDYINPVYVPAFMLNCDILIAPYDKDRIETSGGGTNIVPSISPLKIFNYMSSGKPIICTDLPVIHEILENNTTALLCPSGDLAAWKAAVQNLCDDSLFAHQLGQQAKEKFLANYTWEKRAQAIIKKLLD